MPAEVDIRADVKQETSIQTIYSWDTEDIIIW